MATKKILTDEDFKELNHTLLEEWEKGNATSVTILHDGSIWYKGMYGGFGDKPFIKHSKEIAHASAHTIINAMEKYSLSIETLS